jgi:flagellar protein FlbD
MIHLTRLNGQPLIINSDMIKLIENAPDTVISLANGEKFVVRESGEEVLERIVEFRRRVLEGVGLNFSGWAPSKTEAAASKRRESESDER